MTHIIGWKNSRGVFISGDSAITSTYKESIDESKLKNRKSTFGESHVLQQDQTIQESVLKLYNIEDKLILGFAGTAATATDVIDKIKKNLIEDEDCKKTIREALWCHKFPKNIELIIGYYKNEMSVLLSYNCDGNRKLIEHERNVMIGNLNEKHREISLGTSNFVIDNEDKRTDDESLLMVNATHQGMIITDELIKTGVGGFFTGCYLNKDGVTWQKDTSYIIYDIDIEAFRSSEKDPNLIYKNPWVINLLNRENRVVMESPNIDGMGLYKNYLRRTASSKERAKKLNDDIQWYQKWGEEAYRLLHNAQSDYYCFFCKSPVFPLRITFVSKESNIKEKWFSIARVSESDFTMDFEEYFINQFKPRDAKDAEAHINIHWCVEGE